MELHHRKTYSQHSSVSRNVEGEKPEAPEPERRVQDDPNEITEGCVEEMHSHRNPNISYAQLVYRSLEDCLRFGPMNKNQLAFGKGTYWLTRVVFLRCLAFIYLVAFKISNDQNEALIGTEGLLPFNLYLNRVTKFYGGTWNSWLRLPTILLFLPYTNAYLIALSRIGIVLSLFILVVGSANKIILTILWILYMSIVNVGQIWFQYGWEMLLLEVGFLAIWTSPTLRVRQFPEAAHLPAVVRWLYRWLLYRLILGAGLIKIRGDQCWRDLTCMNYHYQTQPNPGPLSSLFNKAPEWWHKTETFGNHFIELVAPILLLLPYHRTLIAVGGAIQMMFQFVLILSGNLSFLNWLSMLPAIMCFDDGHFQRFFNRRSRSLSEEVHRSTLSSKKSNEGVQNFLRIACHVLLLSIIFYKSVPVVVNMLSERQIMNSSFDPWKIVNTYGAFGSITRRRVEVVLQGTEGDPTSPDVVWLEYEFRCKPGDINRRPCLLTPYHYRLDWQMWFAGFQSIDSHLWILHLLYKLANKDPLTRSLIAKDPFLKGSPKFVRAVKYQYEYLSMPVSRSFGRADEEGTWWRRRFLHVFVQPFPNNDKKILGFLKDAGYLPQT